MRLEKRMPCRTNGQMLLDQAAKNRGWLKLLTLCTGNFKKINCFGKEVIVAICL